MKTNIKQWSVLLALIVGAGCTAHSRDAILLEDERVLYPVILVGGFFEPYIWQKTHAVEYLTDYGLVFGGTLKAGALPQGFLWRKPAGMKADFYIMEAADPAQGITQWVDDLRETISFVRSVTGAPKVVLVGFGAGGLAARSYAAEWFDDHRLARLVSVGAPHGGLDLAEFGAVAQQWAQDSTLVSRLGTRAAGFLGSALGVDVFAPILRDLDPADAGAALHTINSRPHPTDVAYANIVVTHGGRGSEGPGFSDGFLGGVNTLPAVHRQELTLVSGLAGVQTRVESSDRVRLNGESGYHALHHAVLSAIGGEVAFLRAEIASDTPACRECLRVDFAYTYAGLAHAGVEDASGRLTTFGLRPAIYARGAERFGRVEIPLNDRFQWPLMLHVTSVDGERVFMKMIVQVDTRESTPFVYALKEAPDTLEIRIIGVENLPALSNAGEEWDVLDFLSGPLPDVFVTILIDGEELAVTSVKEEAGDAVTWDEIRVFVADPRRQSIRIQLRDKDVYSYDLIAEVAWPPGELPRGIVRAMAKNGVRFLLEFSWTAEVKRVVDPNPFRV